MTKVVVVGLGPMGLNLALNMKDKGIKVAGYNRSEDKRKQAEQQGLHTIDSFDKLKDFFQNEKKVVWLMVNASAVDKVIEQLTPHLNQGDILIEGGNSHYAATEKRAIQAKDKHINYVGIGVSGGETGARHGPALMPGTSKETYKEIESLLTTIAAKAPQDNKPCVSLVGPGGAGHFVKTVHNGIEYGIMGLIGEVVWIMRDGLHLAPSEIADIFTQWDQDGHPLQSYLIEITAEILKEPGKTGEDFLINKVGDYTMMKGTGMWTCDIANNLLTPIPSIYAAVQSRLLSMAKEFRVHHQIHTRTKKELLSKEQLEHATNTLHHALHLAIISCYAQGMDLIRAGSTRFEYNINLSDVALNWRAGCIIRSPTLLQTIGNAFSNGASHLLDEPSIKKNIEQHKDKLGFVCKKAKEHHVSTPVLDASYNYVAQSTTKTLFSASVQALQRDFFGAHTYTKLDQVQNILKSKDNNKLYHVGWTEQDRPEREVNK